MTDEITLAINHAELENSTKALINELSKENVETLDLSQCQNVWDILEELHTGDFASLRKNVYFANLLRTIGLSIPARERSDTPTSTINNDTPSIALDKNFESVSMSGSIPKDLAVEQKKIELPLLSTLLDEVHLPDKFLKLFKRLKNIGLSHATFKVGDTLGDVVAMTTSELSSLPSVGKSYEETLKELKNLYSNEEFIAEKTEEVKLDSVDLHTIRLSYANLTKEQIKALDKLERHELLGNMTMLLELDLGQISSLSGFGRNVVNELALLKKMLLQEIRKISAGDINFEAWESDFLVPIYTKNLSVEQFGALLLEDIDKYFDRLSDIELDIIQKRWGFVEEKKTLEEIGEEHAVTRERIRQIEKSVNEYLPRYLRFTQEFIWDILEPALSIKLTQRLEDLYSCFNNENDFYEVLGILSGQKNLEEYVRPFIKPDILNSYFAGNGGPVTYEDIKEYLVECELKSVRDVDNAIHYLEQKERIRIDGENVWPLKLRKQEAAAFVLANNPNGLPWLDIAKHVNAGNYSKTNLYIDRPDSAALTDPENIFLAGKGIYKHTRFIDFNLVNIDAIFDDLLNYLDKTNRDVFHLNECYQASELLRQQSYYVIRHVVKHFGETHGFFFDGRSQADSVGLEKDFKRITQKDVILEAMNSSARPLTKNQVAMLLKSKSVNHASFYLDEMLESEQVVQVDRMLYTTPDRAYKDIDMPAYLSAIESLLTTEMKPVDPSMFKEALNRELSATYSKYLYASIARLSASQKGWYRKHSLYSISPIPYKNLTDAVQKHCHAEQTTEQNITALKRHIAITRDTAVIALSNFRREIWH